MTTATASAQTTTTTTAISPASLLAAGGRVMIAAIFVLSGISKFTDPGAALGYIQSVGLPLPQVALAVAIVIELAGGIALIAGFRPRLIALVLAGFSVVTALTFHANLADQNQFIHFFKNIAMAGGLLQIAAFGGGRIAIDRS